MQTRDRWPVTFTLAELWLLHDFIRHEMQGQETWAHPPVSEELNEEIAQAIAACDADGLQEYTFLLGRHDLLAIDYLIRRDYKTPEGASGKTVLLKTFRARRGLAMQEISSREVDPRLDHTYREVKADGSASNDASAVADETPGADS